MRTLILAMASVLSLSSPPTLAVTADDVKCNGCVGKRDIGKKVVTKKNIRKKAFDSKGVKNRSIREKDISPKVLAGPKNVIEVSPEGGNFASPLAALDSIADASATNPYLVRIGPGIYDLGATPLQMKPFVDVEGAGPDATVLRGTAEGDPTSTDTLEQGVVTGAEDASLSDVAVEHTGGGVDTAMAIFNPAGLFRVHHVAARVDGAAVDTAAAIWDLGAAVIRHVHVTAAGTAPTPFGIGTAAGSIADAVVSSTGTGVGSVGVIGNAGSSLRGIDVTASGASVNNFALVANGARVNDINAAAIGGTNAVAITSGTGSIAGAIADAQGASAANVGLFIAGTAVTSTRSTASGAGSTGLRIQAASQVTNSVVQGVPVDNDGGATSCANVYNLNLGPQAC